MLPILDPNDKSKLLLIKLKIKDSNFISIQLLLRQTDTRTSTIIEPRKNPRDDKLISSLSYFSVLSEGYI